MGNIKIAFQGGSHGHFLKYILDRYSALTPAIAELPFDNTGNGTSHKELNYSGKFEWYHPMPLDVPMGDGPIWEDPELPHILITIDKEDIVFLERWVNIRAGDFKIDTDNDMITFSEEYFKKVPIRSKLEELYGIDSMQVPRCVMRDFYKNSFLDLDSNGFIVRDKMYRQQKPKNTFMFPVSAFWNEKLFREKIREVSKLFSLEIAEIDKDVYDAFIDRLPWIKTKDRAKEIVKCLGNKTHMNIDNIDTVEQAYISAWIEQNNDFVTVPYTNQFFKTTTEIQHWLKYYPQHYKAMNPNLPTFNGIPNPFHLAKLKK